jgi:predicted small metal-binding protein
VRVIECPFCGETLAAATDDELVETVRRHMDERHPEEAYDDAQVRELAYDASDS